MSIRIDILNERQESLPENGDIHLTIHDSIKYTDASPATHIDAHPHVYFDWMFWSEKEDVVVRVFVYKCKEGSRSMYCIIALAAPRVQTLSGTERKGIGFF